MQISERELIVMTDDLGEMHHETLPTMYEDVADWAELGRDKARAIGAKNVGRRGFLVGSGVALGGAVLAACGASSKSGSTSGASSSTTVGSGANNDVKIAALATSLENLAVATYQGGI